MMEYDICHMNIACSSMLYMYFLLLLFFLFQQSIIWIFYVRSSFSSSNVTKTAWNIHTQKNNEKNLVIVLILSRFVCEQIMSSDPTPPDYNAADDDPKEDEEMFTSAISPSTANVPLDDDDDDDVNDRTVPFGVSSNKSAGTEGPSSSFGSMRNDQHELSVEKKDDDPSDDEDPFGEKKSNVRSSVPTTPIAPVKSASPEPAPYTPSQLYPNVPSSPSPRTSGFDSQPSTPSQDYKADYGATARQRSNDNDIEITVSDPTKIGDVSCHPQSFNL